MALKAVLDSVDGLPAEVAKEYRQDETSGKYVLDVTPVDGLSLEDAGKLKSALVKERDAVKTLTNKLKVFDGLDPEAAKTAIERLEELTDVDLNADAKAKKILETKEQQLAAKFETQRKQLVEKYDAEAKKTADQINGMTSQLQEHMIRSAATAAVAEHKGSVPLLLPVIERSARMVQTEQGKFVVEILGSDGLPRITTKSGSTDPMSIAEFVGLLKDQPEFARAFDGTNSRGSGSAGSDGRPGSGQYTISSSDARDPAKYRAAKDAATKAGQSLQVTD